MEKDRQENEYGEKDKRKKILCCLLTVNKQFGQKSNNGQQPLFLLLKMMMGRMIIKVRNSFTSVIFLQVTKE